MRSIAAVRAVAGAYALVSTAIFISPVATDGTIYFEPSCHGWPEDWLTAQIARTIVAADHIQEGLGSPEFKKGVIWFLEDDLSAAVRLFKAVAGFTISSSLATEAKPGDLVLTRSRTDVLLDD